MPEMQLPENIKIYLVGGAVRDMLLGLEPKDSDYVVVGATPEWMLEQGFKQVGAAESFPVFLHPKTGEEYALARSEKKTGPGYHGFDMYFAPDVTLTQDLGRRDLSINAMAIDENGKVVDPYHGQRDLLNKVLRHTSTAFMEDPVRVLRLARFAARYNDFTIHEDTVDVMKAMVKHGELDTLTPERVWAEFEKGLMEKEPSRMFKVIKEIGADHIFKEFFAATEVQYLALDRAAQRHKAFEVRFAVIASGFKSSQDYRKWTVPSDSEQVSSLVNCHMNQFVNYDSLTSEERLNLFNQVDVFRRLARFQSVLNVVKLIMEAAEHPEIVSPFINVDVDALLRVNSGAIAAATEDKLKIKDAIREARLNALESVRSTRKYLRRK